MLGSRKKIMGSKRVGQYLSLLTCLMALSFPCYGEITIIPAPVQMTESAGYYRLSRETKIYYHGGSEEVAQYLVKSLSPAMGSELGLEEASAASAEGIILTVVEDALLLDGQPLGKEGYELSVNNNGVQIRANDAAGLFYGVQTLRQLLPVEIFSSNAQTIDWTLPFVDITDYPRFEWRGLHLDVGRHFMPVEFIKNFINQLALHKMNKLHWHLTEDQGWRIEIKKYPKLTEIGAWRDETMLGHYNDRPKRPWWKKLMFWSPAEGDHRYDGQRYGGFYTQDQVRDIVAYAQKRHVVVVPEIELPGHAQAAVAAYPELASSDEKIGVKREWGISHHIYNPELETIEFLKNVFIEVMDLFPSEFIHVGGDEATKTLWENSPRIQTLMKERGLKDEHELQSWFIRQFDGFLSENGRRLIGWDEILEGGLAAGATVMSWRGDKGGIAAAKAGHDVVMADYNYTYFDYYQGDKDEEPLAIGGFLPLEKVYNYNPIPRALSEAEARHILGAQGQLWTEYMKTPEHVEYMAFPRASALSEVLWLNQPEEQRDFDKFTDRLKVHAERLALMDINFRGLDSNP
ncbi:beta-N-acetylhexosaminidase [uncultured Microbulbifer sp.]|uniref:beta-N-acetylhexosaminidase n=1 Tax=uncultured Microbulbifer sp. TaxID=348147 RepID=UPI002615BDD7|nr:beta-N-acetylhexosaminidase [uncultured Microbulbifer sp.]